MEKYVPHLGHFSLIEACNQVGCPICTIEHNAVSTYLQAILSHYVDDSDMRERLCLTWGYCHTHARMLPTVERGNLLTIAVMYQDILEKGVTPVLTRKKGIPKRSFLSSVTRRLFKGKQQMASGQRLPLRNVCLACNVEREVETTVLQILLNALAKQDEQMLEALHRSDGICLPHVSRALTLAQNASSHGYLLDVVQAKIALIQAELGEFIRKHDYRYQHESVGDEKWSWKRAITLIVGNRQ